MYSPLHIEHKWLETSHLNKRKRGRLNEFIDFIFLLENLYISIYYDPCYFVWSDVFSLGVGFKGYKFHKTQVSFAHFYTWFKLMGAYNWTRLSGLNTVLTHTKSNTTKVDKKHSCTCLSTYRKFKISYLILTFNLYFIFSEFVLLWYTFGKTYTTS